ncbi:MAG: ThuA domain-containing protein [Planctomycetales bacterium]|nr:ThuA domain-containing protein [Planctomycetales bacterium]
MTSLNRRDMLTTSSAALLASLAWPGTRVLGADEAPKRVLMFTRSAGFQHPVIHREGDNLSFAERVLTELGAAHNIEVVATKDGGVFDDDLDQWDAFFFYTTGDLTDPSPKDDGSKPMSAEGKQRLLDAVASGKGFLGSHCASDTFHSQGPAGENQVEPDPYIAMLGGEFITHGPQQKAGQIVVDEAFPGADGLGHSFKLNEEWYSLKNFPDDLHVILAQDTQGMESNGYNRPPYPGTWARMHGKGRVFYTSMGHREDVWTNEDFFQPLVLGGLEWALGRVDADVTPNISRVTPGAHVMPRTGG